MKKTKRKFDVHVDVRLTMGKKLIAIFGFLAILFIAFGLIAYTNLNRTKSTAIAITSKQLPSEAKLNELFNLVNDAGNQTKGHLLDVWMGKANDRSFLETLTEIRFPQISSKLDLYSPTWDSSAINLYNSIKEDIDKSLFLEISRLLRKLDSFDNSWSDDEKSSFIEAVIYPQIADEGKLLNHINLLKKQITQLNSMVSANRQITEQNFIFEYVRSTNIIIYWGIALVFAILAIAIYIYTKLVSPVIVMKEMLMKMSQGILNENYTLNRSDEIGDMFKALNGLNSGLQETSDFAKEIGKGNYSVQYSPMSAEDELGNALLELRNDLEKANKEANERKEQDQIQNWATRGLANFADILRLNNNDISEFGRKIISNLVNYLKINQGGIYIYNDDDPENCYLDLIAMYAYSRDKFANKKILPGEGLVGVCFLEKQTVYMTEVPDSYIEITSGLGEANPKSILIVPLKIEENVLGVIELASFNEFKAHEISFIEKVCENIASTLHTVRVNNSTAKLLEQSKIQAEVMRKQEQEQNENLEEMTAIQEESAHNQEVLEGKLSVAQKEIERLKGCIAEMEKSL